MRTGQFLGVTILIGALFALPLVGQEDERARSRESLLEILRRAQPIPEPLPGSFSEHPERGAVGGGAMVERDLRSGEERTVETDLRSSDEVPEVAEVGGREPRLASAGEAQGAPSAPLPVVNSIAYPFRTVVKLLVRYNVFGIDYYYVCSAAILGDFHLLTAGHCAYNHDPNGDGFTGDASFMTEAWAWPAQTDRVDPILVEDFPFGWSQPVYTRAPTSWINSQDLASDWAILTLDRRVGEHTGWMGRESGVQASALNFSGYPVEPPYVPAGTFFQYAGYDPGNVSGYTAGRIGLDALVYGGHSGGPVWRFASGNRFLQGVLSTSDRAGSAEATRLTSAVVDLLDSLMSEDESVRPPVARPDLIEYQFVTDAKDLLKNVAAPGQSFGVEYNVFNVGHAGTGPITVDFYLSENNIISTFDTYLGSRTPGALAPFTFFNPTITLTVPQGQPSGTYWVGWVMSGTVPEYNVFDNAAVIDSETLLVTSQGGGPDIRVGPLELRFDQSPVPTGDPIFVEIDWMEDGGHSHRPSQQVINTIKDTFARAGYDLRITVSNSIPHQQYIDIQNAPSVSPAVQSLMNQHFDKKNDSRYFYSIWGHSYSYNGQPGGSSGIGDLPGRVHLVTLGTFPGNTGTNSHQIGTFIHEFGHNLGQKHGGVDHGNHKPNYMSIMNYHFQLEGIGPSLVTLGLANNGSGFDDFGYSHGLAAALDESNLNESLGIGLGKAVDWNCSGSIQSGVATDIQGADWCSAAGGLSVLTDFDNWSDLLSYIRTSRSPRSPEAGWAEPCISWEEHRSLYERAQALGAKAALSGPSSGAAQRGPSGEVQRTFTIYNDGSAALQVTSMALSSPANWIQWTPSAPFAVAPGGNVQVKVTADVGQAASGETSRRLLVRSNDPDESPVPGGVTLVVAGQGVAGPIFTDGFESGNISKWSSAVGN